MLNFDWNALAYQVVESGCNMVHSTPPGFGVQQIFVTQTFSTPVHSSSSVHSLAQGFSTWEPVTVRLASHKQFWRVILRQNDIFFNLCIENLNSWIFQLILKSNSIILAKNIALSIYCNIALSFYRNIACKNHSCDVALTDLGLPKAMCQYYSCRQIVFVQILFAQLRSSVWREPSHSFPEMTLHLFQ